MNTPNPLIDAFLLVLLLAAAIRANSSGLFLKMLALVASIYTTAFTLYFWNGMYEWLATNMTFVHQGWLAFIAYCLLTLLFGTLLGWAAWDINSRYTISYPHALNLFGGTILGLFALIAICAHLFLGLGFTPMRDAAVGPSTLLNGIGNAPTNLFHRVEMNWLNHQSDDLRIFPEYKESARADDEKAEEEEPGTVAPRRRPNSSGTSGSSKDDDWGGAVAPPGPMLPGCF